MTPYWLTNTAAVTATTTSAENVYVFPAWGTAATTNTISADTISITGN
jgi:hypothetical protein